MEKKITVGDLIELFDEVMNVEFLEGNNELCSMKSDSKSMYMFKDRVIEKFSVSAITRFVRFHLVSQEV